MVQTTDIEKYGTDVIKLVKVEVEDQVLTLEIDRKSILDVAERYKYVAEQYEETGLSYAYTEIYEENRTVLWEVVRMMRPTLSEGDKSSIYELKRNNTTLQLAVERAIEDYVTELMDVEQIARAWDERTERELKTFKYRPGDRVILRRDADEQTRTHKYITDNNIVLTIGELIIDSRGNHYTTKELKEEHTITDDMIDPDITHSNKEWEARQSSN